VLQIQSQQEELHGLFASLKEIQESLQSEGQSEVSTLHARAGELEATLEGKITLEDDLDQCIEELESLEALLSQVQELQASNRTLLSAKVISCFFVAESGVYLVEMGVAWVLKHEENRAPF
jgi:hypothetical protein